MALNGNIFGTYGPIMVSLLMESSRYVTFEQITQINKLYTYFIS